MQLKALEDFVSPDKIDTVLTYLTYNVAVWTFVITVVVLFVTALTIRTPLIENARARQDEAEARKAEAIEKRNSRALELIRLAAGYDPVKGGPPQLALQLAAFHLLEHYPEYHSAFVTLYDDFKDSPNPFLVRGIKRLADATLPR